MLRCSDVIRVLDESPLSNLAELTVVLYLATCLDRPTSSVSQGRLKFLFASAPFPVHSVPLVLPSAFFHCPFTPLLSVAGCPPSCLSLPPQPLDICFISAGCLLPGPSFLISLTDPLITLIGFSGVVGRLVISGRLAPAARLASKFITSTVNYKYMTALHITIYIYAYPRYLDCLSVTSLFLNNSSSILYIYIKINTMIIMIIIIIIIIITIIIIIIIIVDRSITQQKPSPLSDRTVIGDGVLRPKTASCMERGNSQHAMTAGVAGSVH